MYHIEYFHAYYNDGWVGVDYRLFRSRKSARFWLRIEQKCNPEHKYRIREYHIDGNETADVAEEEL